MEMNEIILLLIGTFIGTPMSSKFLLVELEDMNDDMITPHDEWDRNYGKN